MHFFKLKKTLCPPLYNQTMSADVVFSLFNIYLPYLFNLDERWMICPFSFHILKGLCMKFRTHFPFSYFHGASLLLTFVIRFSCVMNLRFNEFIYYFDYEKVHQGRQYIFGQRLVS